MAKSAAERAYDAAVKEIRRVGEAGKTTLDLREQRFRALDQIPEAITSLTALKILWLNQTAVTDLAPLSGLTALQKLDLDRTAVTDLAPLAGLTALQLLDLTQTAVTDLAPLAGLAALEMLDLNQTAVSDLAPLAGLTALRALVLNETAVIDLAPLAGLTALSNLSLEGTRVADLRPIRDLKRLGRNRNPGLTFRTTPATVLDGDLARLAEINDTKDRVRETLAYLATLPPWPEPYTPHARPDGQPPQPVGQTMQPAAPVPALRTAEAQIAALLRHAIVTRVTAVQLADQIANALRGIPATEGNQLPPILQLMSEVGEVLGNMGSAQATAVADERSLRLRIAQLEGLVERLTEQLKDANEATKAAEALAKKEGFLAPFKKSLGTTVGIAAGGIVSVGVPTAAIYFLGAEHPLVHAFLTVIGKLPK